jgi:hypothetical protein
MVEVIYDGAFKGEWESHGWSDSAPKKGRAERLNMVGYGGWILNRYALKGTFGGVRFELKAPAIPLENFELRVDSDSVDVFPRVRLNATHARAMADGWVEIFVSMKELNPTLTPFSRVVIRAANEIAPPGIVEFDRIGLTAVDPEQVAAAQKILEQPGLPAALLVDCKAEGVAISPLIYGIAYSPLRENESTVQFSVNPTARRWGGNPTTRFNWELGNAWNTASDYFFANTTYGHSDPRPWQTFLENNRDRGLQSALTVPIMGWVAKDTTSGSFPLSEAGPQQEVCPENPKLGNGVDLKGKPIRPPPPARTSVASTPAFVGAWVTEIKKLEAKRGRLVHQYILDNEPALWHDTHRDVHPQPLTYDELVEKTIAYGTAIRKADPEALIAGPAEWGWPAYFYSAADAVAGFSMKPDRRAHGDVPLIEWYLQKLRAHEQKTGVRVLDILDLHHYPQGNGVGVGTDGSTDPATNALRIRSVRGLWDARYSDESWIKEPVRLIPRMKEWIDKHYPGLKISIGEYNFGAERHPSGGLALAEALGRFGQHGVYSAFYWTYPPENSPAFWAFRAYRNFDGKGGRFLDVSLPTEAPKDMSLFASKSTDGKTMTLVVLNASTSETYDASVNLKGCAQPSSHRVFSWAGNPTGFSERKPVLGKSYKAPPMSITVVELQFNSPKKAP